MTKPLRIVGINFDHFHMGDLLRMAQDPLPAKFQNPIAYMAVDGITDHLRDAKSRRHLRSSYSVGVGGL